MLVNDVKNVLAAEHAIPAWFASVQEPLSLSVILSLKPRYHGGCNGYQLLVCILCAKRIQLMSLVRFWNSLRVNAVSASVFVYKYSSALFVAFANLSRGPEK